jgi:hypothetical protein
MSPRQATAAKPATTQAQKHHAHRHKPVQDQITLRRRLHAPKNLDGCCTTLSVSTGHEDGSADKEIISKTVNAQRQGQGNLDVQVHEWTVLTLSRSPLPCRNLLLGRNGENVEEVCQWYFACQLPDRDGDFFRSAQDDWVKDMWDMGRSSEPMFSALGAFAMHKKAILGGSKAKPDYYEQKCHLIQNIIIDIRRCPAGPAPSTVVAMATLAYLDIRENQSEAAGAHLRAVSSFIDMPKLSNQGWIYCTWTDLRYALFTIQEPFLPFYIPLAFRGVPAVLHPYQREAFRLGALNASRCPRSPAFTLNMASDIFGKLHALCYYSGIPATPQTPPFGQVYALEYGLRVVQARAKRNDGDIFTAPIMLITSAIQLHVWMAARFYTPQARETHLGLITIASEVIAGFDDLVSQWYITAGLESLLWVLFTIVASLHAHELPQTTEVLEMLHKALRMAHIDTCNDLEERLKH